jgi:hypothetical protein
MPCIIKCTNFDSTMPHMSETLENTSNVSNMTTHPFLNDTVQYRSWLMSVLLLCPRTQFCPVTVCFVINIAIYIFYNNWLPFLFCFWLGSLAFILTNTRLIRYDQLCLIFVYFSTAYQNGAVCITELLIVGYQAITENSEGGSKSGLPCFQPQRIWLPCLWMEISLLSLLLGNIFLPLLTQTLLSLFSFCSICCHCRYSLVDHGITGVLIQKVMY